MTARTQKSRKVIFIDHGSHHMIFDFVHIAFWFCVSNNNILRFNIKVRWHTKSFLSLVSHHFGKVIATFSFHDARTVGKI